MRLQPPDNVFSIYEQIAKQNVCFNMEVYARIAMQTRESLNWIMSEKLAVLKMNILLK